MPSPAVLLVDDEPALLDLLQRYLVRLGYTVEPCGGAQDAIHLVRADPERFGLLVTDLTLPEMSGEELVVRLREFHPRLPAIIASGYPHEPQTPRTEFLQKPFLPRMLAEAIERVLGSPQDRASAGE